MFVEIYTDRIEVISPGGLPKGMTLADLTEPGRAAHLHEIFIAACHEKADEIDDSSGNFDILVEDLFRGWIKARQAPILIISGGDHLVV